LRSTRDVQTTSFIFRCLGSAGQVRPEYITEKIVEIPVKVRKETVTEVPQVHRVEIVRQELATQPTTRHIQVNLTPPFDTSTIPDIKQVPRMLIHEVPVEVPAIQNAMVFREEPLMGEQVMVEGANRVIMKQVPDVEWVEKLVALPVYEVVERKEELPNIQTVEHFWFQGREVATTTHILEPIVQYQNKTIPKVTTVFHDEVIVSK